MDKAKLQLKINEYSSNYDSLHTMVCSGCPASDIERQQDLLHDMTVFLFCFGYKIIHQGGRWCLCTDDAFSEIVVIAEN